MGLFDMFRKKGAPPVLPERNEELRSLLQRAGQTHSDPDTRALLDGLLRADRLLVIGVEAATAAGEISDEPVCVTHELPQGTFILAFTDAEAVRLAERDGALPVVAIAPRRLFALATKRGQGVLVNVAGPDSFGLVPGAGLTALAEGRIPERVV